MPDQQRDNFEDFWVLLCRARSGSSEAMGILLGRFERFLWLSANRKLGAALRPKMAASDIVQQTMLKAFRDFPQFEGTTSAELASWLHTTLMHNLINAVDKYRSSLKRDLGKEDRRSSAENLSAGDPTPSAYVSMNEQKQIVLSVFSKLPLRSQQCLRARFQDGQLPEDIALSLGTTAEAARKMVSRALQEWVEHAEKEGLEIQLTGADVASLLNPDLGHENRPEKISRYRIDKELGSGTFGVVYGAVDVGTGRHVAIKIPRGFVLQSAGLRKRFTREGALLSTLLHPNLVRVYEAGETDEVCFLACELCCGPSLKDWQANRPDILRYRLACKIVADIAEGVAYSHSKGIVHRDIKPSNILLEPMTTEASGEPGLEPALFPYTPKLADFGLAKAIMEESGLTGSGDILGTPFYMAPEQAGVIDHPVGPATDIYSLGILLFELLTNISPVHATTLLGRTSQSVFRNLPSIREVRPDIPVNVEKVLTHCLSLHPVDRYPCAKKLAEELRQISKEA